MTQAIKCEEEGCGGSAYAELDGRLLCQLCYHTQAVPHKMFAPYKSPIFNSFVTSCGRQFDTGAYRDTEEGKLDFEGFLSPSVLKRYAEYMHKNRTQSNGELRDSDNWQKGIPESVYMKSMWRHFFSVWEGHRSNADCIQEDLCALLFNVMGMLHEDLQD